MVDTGKLQVLADIQRQKREESLVSDPQHLPLWPDIQRGVPNGFLRSALFGAIAPRGPRRYMRREPIASIDGVSITYSGGQLDQADLDVWESVLHIARHQSLGNECRSTAYQLLKYLNKKDTGGNREVLDRRLSTLNATALAITIGRYSYEGSLIEEVYRDHQTREYVIRLNPKMIVLFESDQWTSVEWRIRQDLMGNPLAQWLHGFYSSHARPFPISVETIHKLCGSTTKQIRNFKIDLRRALGLIEDTSMKYGQAFHGEIKDDLIHVQRTPSTSQKRHLEKRAQEQNR